MQRQAHAGRTSTAEQWLGRALYAHRLACWTCTADQVFDEPLRLGRRWTHRLARKRSSRIRGVPYAGRAGFTRDSVRSDMSASSGRRSGKLTGPKEKSEPLLALVGFA